MPRISTSYKLTMLLALLSTAPAFVTSFNKTKKNDLERAMQRASACEQLALSCALNLRDRDYDAIGSLISSFASKSKPRALRMVRFDGLVVEQTGQVEGLTNSLDTPPATPGDIRVPINRNGRQWGTLQVVYPVETLTSQWSSVGRVVVTTFSLNLLSFGLLLRRALSTLDNSKTDPKRVRNTLDTIAGGVVILDAKRRLVMANEAFQHSMDLDGVQLLGKTLNDFSFVEESTGPMPWDLAIESGERRVSATIHLKVKGEADRCFVVNATPIFDAREHLAGALVSFEDVTTLEAQKQTLVLAMSELETSKELIRQQNVELTELASKDALTGIFNRRSLFEQFEKLWNDRDKSTVNCIMLDVDHFKKLNDNHGHAVGDQVLRDVSRTLQDCVRAPGFVGRYGGEEFCVVLPSMSVFDATAVGEEIRAAIEANLAEPYKVTASFGVSGSELGATNYQAMLEQADQALYVAKDGGRNAVCCWSEDLPVEGDGDDIHAAAVVRWDAADQPISYHAVASLHAALAYRDADTALHSQRVAEYAVALGRGLMSVSELYVLEIAGILHDVGKIGVPDAILLKPSKLEQEEWKVMEAHARMGVEIVDSSFDSKELSDIVRYHHYRFDGTNTPQSGPVGKDIPLGARIVCIVDAFDAMISNRVYRKGRSVEEAFAELQRCAGSQFDPDLVERFIELKIGWRADSRYFQSDFEDKVAIAVGHLIERTLHSFEQKERESLQSALAQLERTGAQNDLLAISHLSKQLSEAIAGERTDNWDEWLPILHNLLEMCMTIQRAHIRGVAARPQATENCPQQQFYSTARSWDQELVSNDD